MPKPKLSIVVPYRNRESHLTTFIPYMEDFLYKQGIPYHIFIIEQDDDKPFNRGKLLNIGFKESQNYDYFCFHDIDMLPLESDYSPVPHPTHLAAKVEQFDWGVPYGAYFGGVNIFDKESFLKINGYSNEYWGWGMEDDDCIWRCRSQNIQISRKPGKYKVLAHEKFKEKELYDKNVKKYAELINDSSSMNQSGLSNLSYEKSGMENISDHAAKIRVKV